MRSTNSRTKCWRCSYSFGWFCRMLMERWLDQWDLSRCYVRGEVCWVLSGPCFRNQMWLNQVRVACCWDCSKPLMQVFPTEGWKWFPRKTSVAYRPILVILHTKCILLLFFYFISQNYKTYCVTIFISKFELVEYVRCLCSSLFVLPILFLVFLK